MLNAASYDVDYYLFDAPGTDYRGGSGHTFDWSLLEQSNIPREKIILAGGLNPSNVAQAIGLVQPFGVDVSSGVEKDGVKDSCINTKLFTSSKRSEYTMTTKKDVSEHSADNSYRKL